MLVIMKRQRAVTFSLPTEGQPTVRGQPKAVIVVVIFTDTYSDPSYLYNPDPTKGLLEEVELFSPEAGIFEQDTERDWPETINGWTEIDSDQVDFLTSEQWCKVIHRYI